MRVLLDECVDRRLATEIFGHEVKTVPKMGWATIKNGELLSRAERHFDVFVTTDQNLTFQQNVPKFNLVVVVLRASTNRLVDLKPLVPELLRVLPNVPKSQVTVIE